MILFDMKVWELSPSFGNKGNQTRMPWAPQNSHRASVKWGFSRRNLFGTQTFSTYEARAVGAITCQKKNNYFIPWSYGKIHKINSPEHARGSFHFLLFYWENYIFLQSLSSPKNSQMFYRIFIACAEDASCRKTTLKSIKFQSLKKLCKFTVFTNHLQLNNTVILFF